MDEFAGGLCEQPVAGRVVANYRPNGKYLSWCRFIIFFIIITSSSTTSTSTSTRASMMIVLVVSCSQSS